MSIFFSATGVPPADATAAVGGHLVADGDDVTGGGHKRRHGGAVAAWGDGGSRHGRRGHPATGGQWERCEEVRRGGVERVCVRSGGEGGRSEAAGMVWTEAGAPPRALLT